MDRSLRLQEMRVGPTETNRPPPHFFVSYAHHSIEDDEHVRQFYKDLSKDVQLFAGVRSDVGFCDVSLRAGDQWSSALVEALCTCQVFLALCSPTYFSRPACGKEWTIFTHRLAGRPRGNKRWTAHLIPLFWVPMEMPEVAQAYQHRDAAFGAAYRECGLRDLIRSTDRRNDYHRFVQALANRIVELVKQVTIPPYLQRPKFDAVEAAFPPSSEPSYTPPRRQDEPWKSPVRSDRNAGALPERDPVRPMLNPQDPLRPPPELGRGGHRNDQDAGWADGG